MIAQFAMYVMYAYMLSSGHFGHVTSSNRCFCLRQMFPRHFKGDSLQTFGLDHFQEIIRLQHMVAVVKSQENRVEIEVGVYLTLVVIL